MATIKPGSDAWDRFWDKVEKTEGCWNWTGAKDNHGYGNVRVNKLYTKAHRVSFAATHGPIPEGMLIDHKCHTPSCVRPDHLRLATPKQNGENQIRAHCRNKSSGIRGVTWDQKKNSWRAQVGHNGKQLYCGLYSTMAEAEAAAIAKRNELYTHNDADRREAAK
ncbi:MAG: HNH endonuclease signature motif containing protein [Marmoricola sp.]